MPIKGQSFKNGTTVSLGKSLKMPSLQEKANDIISGCRVGIIPQDAVMVKVSFLIYDLLQQYLCYPVRLKEERDFSYGQR